MKDKLRENRTAELLDSLGRQVRGADVSSRTVARTCEQARELLAERRPLPAAVLRPAWSWRPVIAWAAALFVAVAALYGLRRTRPPPAVAGIPAPPSEATRFAPDAEILSVSAGMHSSLADLRGEIGGAEVSGLERNARSLRDRIALYTVHLEQELGAAASRPEPAG